jgi:hypothetical protein
VRNKWVPFALRDALAERGNFIAGLILGIFILI